MTHQTDVDVLIVGAGPTGLTMACLLAKYGVKFKIVEKNKTITERSKALGVQARTLELFEILGISEKAVAQGHPAEGLDLVVRGKLRATMNLTANGRVFTKFPYMLILEQCKTEKLLVDRLQALGGKVEWQHEIVDLQHHEDSVTATISHLDHLQSVTAKYIVAADGARSYVRNFLKLPFEGGTYENRFLLADVALDWRLSRSHITLCLSHKGFAGFFPMYGSNRYRAIGVLPEALSGVPEEKFQQIAEDIQKQADVPMTISDPLWLSTYKLHHRNICRFRYQRVFFAGDAAHIHSPAGAQGMNTGIQDAFNLAWKLHFALNGWASEKLLDTYHDERYPCARRLVHTTDRAFGFITSPRPLVKFARLYVLPYVLNILSKTHFFQRYVFRNISQIAIKYRKSPLTYQNFISDKKCQAGDRFSEPSFADDGVSNRCCDGKFHAYIVGEPTVQKEMSCLMLSYLSGQVEIHTLDKKVDIHNILLSFGILKDGLVLVRPDQYVAYCSDGLNVEELSRYLKKYYRLRGPEAPKVDPFVRKAPPEINLDKN